MNHGAATVLRYPEIRRMLREDGSTVLLDRLDLLASVALLGAGSAGAAGALALLGPKSEVVRSGQQLIGWLTKRKGGTAIERYRRLAAAHELLVASAFFEAAQAVTQRFDPSLELERTEEEEIADEAAQTPSAARTVVGLPHPAEGLRKNEAVLGQVYRPMTMSLGEFLRRLAAWQQLGDDQATEVNQALISLPDRAIATYRAQYLALGADVPEFLAWITISADEALMTEAREASTSAAEQLERLASVEDRLDVGFRSLSDRVASLPSLQRADNARRITDGLKRRYEAAVLEPVIRDETAGETLVYPRKCDAFVPQSFRVFVIPSRNAGERVRLEDEQLWRLREEHEDPARFLLSFLDSPYSLDAPLMILGVPGSGKSLLTQMLAARLATPQFNPVRIELRNIDVDRDIQTLIEDQVRADTGLDVNWADFSGELADTPPLVILDGFDELLQASGRMHADFLEQVQKFQSREATMGRPVRVIVTSRITLIDKAVVPPGSTIMRLLDFDRARRQRWAEIWNEHNAEHFRAAGIEPFVVPEHQEVQELACQPLLLLMLALFDSEANELRIRHGLDRTRLYDDLLRRFIRRELSKAGSAEFYGLDEDEQAKLIDTEMRRLRAVAIGMYNRRSLHILSDDLEKDITYLRVVRTPPALRGRPLTQADLLLGSFFFIHRSDEGTGAGTAQGRVGSSAFEFLHNTFGEFLTADFTLRTVLGEAVSVASMRAQPALQPQCELKLSQGNLPPEWFVALMYTPLHERPVILDMMGQWVGHVLADHDSPAPDEVMGALEALVQAELGRLLDGNVPPSLMAGDTSAPYPSLPLLAHYAVYTLNLVLLGVVVTAPERRLTLKRGAWERLVALWRTWISFDDLAGVVRFLHADVNAPGVELVPRPWTSEAGKGGHTFGLERVAETATALLDEPLAALARLHVFDVGYGEASLADLDEELIEEDLDFDFDLANLLREVRDKGWDDLDEGDYRRLTRHAEEAASLGYTSRAHSELLERLLDRDVPSVLRRAVSAGLATVVDSPGSLATLSERHAMALFRLLAKHPALWTTLLDRADIIQLLAGGTNLAGLILRLARPYRSFNLAPWADTVLNEPHPETLASLATHRLGLNHRAGEAAIDALITMNPGPALAKISSEALVWLTAAADQPPVRADLAGWLAAAVRDHESLAQSQVDTIEAWRFAHEHGHGGALYFHDAAQSIAVAGSPWELGSFLRLVANLPPDAQSGAEEHDVRLPPEAVDLIPLAAVESALRVGEEMLGAEAFAALTQRLDRLRNLLGDPPRDKA
jgi:hypothetical protein